MNGFSSPQCAAAESKAIFLDKDGTLLADVPFNVDPDKMCLVPGAGRGLRALQAAGYKLIVISNQSGVAHGFFAEQALEQVTRRLTQLLAGHDVRLGGFYYCPHHPRGSVPPYDVPCACRKPAPGMIFQAAGELGIELATSWVVGDILDDVEAGQRAGCRTLLIDNGNETEWLPGPFRRPHACAVNLSEAAEMILGEAERPASAHSAAAGSRGAAS